MDASEREAWIVRYEDGPRLLEATLGKVPSQALKFRPAPGKWTVHEVVVHCADSETNAAGRIRYLAAEKDPLVIGYDQDLWATALTYHEHPLELALATIKAVRANTTPLLRRLPEAAWKRMGRHSEVGAFGSEDWLRSYGEHLEVHSRQIERNLAAWRAQA